MRIYLQKYYLKLSLILMVIVWGFFSFQPKQASEINTINLTQDTIKANELKREAEILFSKYEYEKATKTLENAKQIFQQYQLWEAVVSCVVRQAFISDNLAFETKKTYANEALSLAKTHLHKSNFQLGKAYQQVAEVQMMDEKYDSSIVSFNRAINILEKQKKWSDYAWATISKSVNYYYLGKYKPFKTTLYNAQNIYEKYDLDEEIYITTLDLLALAYDEEGDFDKAIENIKNSIQFYLNRTPLNKSDSSFIATNYMNISATYNQMGAFQQANSYLLKAVNYSKGVNQDDYTNALFFICSDAFNNENYLKSIKYGHLCIAAGNEISEKEKAKISTFVYQTIGQSYMFLNQYDSSEYYFKKAIILPYNKHSLHAQISYTSLLLRQKRTDEALKILNNIPDNKGLEAHSKAQLYMNFGKAYGQKGILETSMLYFQKSLHQNLPYFTDTLEKYANPKDLRQVENPLFVFSNLKYKAQNLALFSDKQENLEAALVTYDLAFRWIDTLLQSYAYDDVRIISNQNNREIYEQAIDVTHQLYQRTNDEKYINKAFEYTEKIKSNILLVSLQKDKNLTIIPKSIQDREKNLAVNVSFYERQLQLAKDNKSKNKIKLYQNYLADYRINLGELKDSIKDNFPQYYDLKYSSTLATISTIQTDLESNQGFISYYSGDSSTYVFTISKSDFHFSKLNHTATIDDKVIAFRQMLGQPNSTIEGFMNYNQTATDLYTTILQNSVEQLPKSVNQLTIVPDGTLNYIPFEILTSKTVKTASQDFSKLPYLLYDYQIHYAYSATLLRENKRLQNQLKTNSKCLAYAPPYESNEVMTQGRGTMQTLRDGTMQLQGTGKEIQAIATHFEGDFDQSETATKAKFLKQAPKFGILHLAMHGEANFENEHLANLKFTNTKTQDKEQYLLYQNEIANMNLNAQLVVLSACETGLGKYIYGEGIASLGRSFMYAGVPSIVMSLWKVDDKATSQLMPYFYENLAQGMNKDEALHQAKLTFLKKEDLSTLHPHYWAGFVEIGDNQPIKKDRNWSILLILGAFVLALGSGFVLWKKIKK